ncbi:hypothetical protein Y694_03766 [Methylibium sp. T29-B]|nr:hypothetical protein Y694_03766 [Methylibium sp. T29-B]
MLMYRELSWWYWAVTAALLIAGLAGWAGAFHAATALSALQVLHFRWREGRFAAFPVQVRLAFTGLLLLAAWPPMKGLFWVPAIGTTAQVLFGYCLLARGLSLLPWNRRERGPGGCSGAPSRRRRCAAASCRGCRPLARAQAGGRMPRAMKLRSQWQNMSSLSHTSWKPAWRSLIALTKAGGGGSVAPCAKQKSA